MSEYQDPEHTGPLRIKQDPPPVSKRPMDAKHQPRKKDRHPIPNRQGNGYYADHVTGERLRSVTTILSGGVPKPGLVHWAGNMCTDCAIENLPALVAASRFPDQLADLRKWVTRAHTRKKDERADVGTAVHIIIESRILGIELPATIMVGEGDSREEVPLDGPELKPFVENFTAFEAEWKPRWQASEMVVANRSHGYAGTLDYVIGGDGPIGDALRWCGYQVPDGVDIMGDTKTGGDWDHVTSGGHVHGVYPEAGLQMSAYRRAEIAWLRDASRVPMPPTAEVGVVLHLRPEGFRLYPVRCGELEYQYFRHAQMVDEWSSRIASAKANDPVIGPPLRPVTPTPTGN